MLRLSFLSLVSLALCAALPSAYDAVLSRTGASLQIDVSGVSSSAGHILVALYTDPATWTKSDAAVATAKVPAREGTVRVDFPELTPGTYGIALLHDEDDSGDMTTNLLGIPKEAYGFGNDARGIISAPDFAQSTVEVRGRTVTSVRVK